MTSNSAISNPVQTGEAKVEAVPENIFAVKNQAELNSLIHRKSDTCPGDCEWCKAFHRASVPIKAAEAEGFIITLSRNVKTVGTSGRFLVWCNYCSDGENTNFYDACDWALHHAVKRHES